MKNKEVWGWDKHWFISDWLLGAKLINNWLLGTWADTGATRSGFTY